MEASPLVINLIKQFEQLRLKAYKCQSDVWTIGYGHTRGVLPGDVITPEQAERLLHEDVQARVTALNKILKVKLTQDQFDAIVSFVFNIKGGVPRFASTTMCLKLNKNDIEGAAQEFRKWIHITKDGITQKSKGLVRRRAIEESLFRGMLKSFIW